METPFTFSAKPGTDIWKKPPSHNVFSAPYRSHSIAPLHLFRSATITFKASYTQQYDQAGILFALTKPTSKDTPRKWIKAGVEYYNSSPRLSTVCCDNWADWSIAPVPENQRDDIVTGKKSITLYLEKEKADIGVCLWVYRVEDNGDKTPLREICWIFSEEPEKWELEIGAAIARPGKDLDEALEATFEKLEVEWAKKHE